MTAQQDWDRQAVQKVIEHHQHTPGGLLPVLHGIQDILGYVPDEAVEAIADGLNLSRAEVHGVISFYHYFRTSPPAKHTVHVCRAEACQSMKANDLVVHIKNRLGLDFHEVSESGMFGLEPIYCLGNCSCAPAIMIDRDEIHGRMTEDKFDSLVARLQGEGK
ncbi:MAG: formate dehydrogenase subunit gamma [Proteobacteria bacterium]|nr:formate dehydrogenase subunit gamma [Pseudomonadota bacterium]MDE3209008.1 formate dehydrogenase subunit gamma [Pseudomonadota bacterium]